LKSIIASPFWVKRENWGKVRLGAAALFYVGFGHQSLSFSFPVADGFTYGFGSPFQLIGFFVLHPNF
jgi:hypothetical protein